MMTIIQVIQRSTQAIFFCSVEHLQRCSSPAATAPRRCGQRPGHHDQLPATNKKRRRGHRPRYPDLLPERQRGHRPRHHDQILAAKNERRRGQRAGASTKYLRRTTSAAAGNGLGTTINEHSPAMRNERRRGQLPGHHDQVPATHNEGHRGRAERNNQVLTTTTSGSGWAPR
jgi:hypothetical protein